MDTVMERNLDMTMETNTNLNTNPDKFTCIDPKLMNLQDSNFKEFTTGHVQINDQDHEYTKNREFIYWDDPENFMALGNFRMGPKTTWIRLKLKFRSRNEHTRIRLYLSSRQRPEIIGLDLSTNDLRTGLSLCLDPMVYKNNEIVSWVLVKEHNTCPRLLSLQARILVNRFLIFQKGLNLWVGNFKMPMNKDSINKDSMFQGELILPKNVMSWFVLDMDQAELILHYINVSLNLSYLRSITQDTGSFCLRFRIDLDCSMQTGLESWVLRPDSEMTCGLDLLFKEYIMNSKTYELRIQEQGLEQDNIRIWNACVRDQIYPDYNSSPVTCYACIQQVRKSQTIICKNDHVSDGLCMSCHFRHNFFQESTCGLCREVILENKVHGLKENVYSNIIITPEKFKDKTPEPKDKVKIILLGHNNPLLDELETKVREGLELGYTSSNTTAKVSKSFLSKHSKRSSDLLIRSDLGIWMDSNHRLLNRDHNTDNSLQISGSILRKKNDDIELRLGQKISKDEILRFTFCFGKGLRKGFDQVPMVCIEFRSALDLVNDLDHILKIICQVFLKSMVSYFYKYRNKTSVMSLLEYYQKIQKEIQDGKKIYSKNHSKEYNFYMHYCPYYFDIDDFF